MAAPIDVGNRKQLFIDYRFIEEAHGIALHVTPPPRPIRLHLAMRNAKLYAFQFTDGRER